MCAVNHTWRCVIAGEKDRGVVERPRPKQEFFKSARKSGLYCHGIRFTGGVEGFDNKANVEYLQISRGASVCEVDVWLAPGRRGQQNGDNRTKVGGPWDGQSSIEHQTWGSLPDLSV